MTRTSKQEERRNRCPRKHRQPGPKTGPKKDNLEHGFRLHQNTLEGAEAQTHFIPTIK